MLFSFFIFLILKAVQIQSTPVAYDPTDSGLVLNAPVSFLLDDIDNKIESDLKWTSQTGESGRFVRWMVIRNWNARPNGRISVKVVGH